MIIAPANTVVVCGISTEVGKTLTSAILAEMWHADYWKPLQAGLDFPTDAQRVLDLIANPSTVIHPSIYKLKKPLSPHAAAQYDGIQIQLAKLVRPDTKRTLIVELAGGVMTPLNGQEVFLDWLAQMMWPVVLVSRHYLGSINHTLLTIEALKQRQIPLLGLVFNGSEDLATEAFISDYTQLPLKGVLRMESRLDKELVSAYARKWQYYWN